MCIYIYIYIFFFFPKKLTGYLGRWTKKHSQFFLHTFQLKKKLVNVNRLLGELLHITRNNNGDSIKT